MILDFIYVLPEYARALIRITVSDETILWYISPDVTIGNLWFIIRRMNNAKEDKSIRECKGN
jgi:hypothetical protein